MPRSQAWLDELKSGWKFKFPPSASCAKETHPLPTSLLPCWLFLKTSVCSKGLPMLLFNTWLVPWFVVALGASSLMEVIEKQFLIKRLSRGLLTWRLCRWSPATTEKTGMVSDTELAGRITEEIRVHLIILTTWLREARSKITICILSGYEASSIWRLHIVLSRAGFRLICRVYWQPCSHSTLYPSVPIILDLIVGSSRKLLHNSHQETAIKKMYKLEGLG